MPDASHEQRIAALEIKIAAIEERLRSIPVPRSIFALFDRPPPTPEDLAAYEEVNRYIREARAELDRQMDLEDGDTAEK